MGLPFPICPVFLGVPQRPKGGVSGKKKGTQTISSGGVGVFHAKGCGPKSSACPLKPRETKLSGGISRDFRRDILEAPEKSEKIMFVFNVALRLRA